MLDMNLVYDTARTWVDRGQSIIPIGYGSKRPAFRLLEWSGAVDDTGRATVEPFFRRLPTDDELRTWFQSGPQAGIGIVTGYNNLAVLDFDSLDTYAMWLEWAQHAGDFTRGVSATGYRVFSARGVHFYVRTQEQVTSFQVGAVDVKAQWGYVLAPPSLHPSGCYYRSWGAEITECASLSDVFPLEPIAPENRVPSPASMARDPWSAAAKATHHSMGIIARIREKMRIEDVLGIPYRTGRTRECCPLHDDRHPSLLVFHDDQRVQCLAGCEGSKQLDVIDLYAALHDISLHDAIDTLGECL